MTDKYLKMKVRLFLLIFYLPVKCIFANQVATFVGKSFTLSSSISVIHLNPENRDEQQKKISSRLVESYSVEQERARINFFISNHENSTSKGIFYLEQSQQTGMKFDSQTTNCEISDVNTILKSLGLDLVPFLKIDSSIAPSHIIGPSRLLHLIDKRKSELKLILNYVIMSAKNIPAKLYSLDIDEYTFTIYYDKEDEVQEIPIQLQIISSTISIQINFSKFSLILDSNQLSESQTLMLRNGAQLNRFTFPPLKSCIQALYSTRLFGPIFPELGKDDKRIKFSFKADIILNTLKFNTSEGKPLELRESPSIAYDSGLNVLKLDVERNSLFKRQLINYKIDRIFQITSGIDTTGSLTERCLIYKAPEKDPRSSTTLILLGSESFVYLGLAHIRGIRAKLYGVLGGSLPGWLEQSVEYKIKLRHDVRRPDADNAMIVLYLSDSLQPTLLHIDITQYYTRHSVDLYDFRWDLDHSVQASDQFSLHDLCSQSDQKHSKVELTLKGISDETTNIPLNTRNLALLASFQDHFNLPVNMVFDLESSVISSGSTIKEVNYLQVAFRVATQKETIVEIEYLGRGKMNPFADSPTSIFSARTFHDCLDAAGSQQKVELYFGYDAPRRTCIIDHGQSTLNFFSRGPYAITLGRNFAFEVYQLKRIRDESIYLYDINARWAHEQTRVKFIGESLKNKLPVAGDQLIVDKMQVQPLDDNIILKLNSSDNSSTDSLTFYGFGLNKDEFSRLITPAPIGSHNWGPLNSYLEPETPTSMSYEQCHATCLSDMKCKSFSICRRDYDIECIISQLSFSDPSVVNQIRDKSVSNLRGKIKVKLENLQTVELIKHANCELYNKMYMELFDRRSKLVKQSVSKRLFRPVQSREECAKLCVTRNLQVLRLDLSLAANSSSLFGPESSSTDDDLKENHEEIRKVRTIHRKVSTLLCRAFYYKDQATITTDEESEIKKRLVNSNLNHEMLDLNGYCAIDEVNPSKQVEDLNKLMFISAEEYRYRMDSFYQKQQGIRLSNSELNMEELAAYEKIDSRSKDVTQVDHSTLRTLVELGDNFQHAAPVLSETTCALKCFLQTSGPWPSCRSFDIVKDQSRTETICLLNSITLHQAIATHRFDLIDDNSSSLIQIWHYEPRAGYTLEDSAFDKEFQGDKEQEKFISKIVYFISLIGLSCVFLFAKISGLYIGVRIGDRIVESGNVNEGQLLGSSELTGGRNNHSFPENITLY